MMHINAETEAYIDGIINDIIWIRRNFNLADAMTKPTITPELGQVVD